MTKWHPATKLLVAGGPAGAALPAVDRAVGPGAGGRGQRGTRAAPDAAELAAVEPPPAQFVLPPLERFTAVVERPLFSPTRRMPPAADRRASPTRRQRCPRRRWPRARPSPSCASSARCGRAARAAALVTYPATAEVARLRLGDAVGEWQVISVERNRLELGLGEERRSFEIFGAGMRGERRRTAGPGGRRGTGWRRRTAGS